MHRLISTLLIATVVAVGFVLPATTHARPAPIERPAKVKFLSSRAERVPDSYLVALSDQIGEADLDKVTGDLMYEYGARSGNRLKHAIRGFSAEMPEALARQLSEDPRVKYVEEDSWGQLLLAGGDTVQSNPGWGLDRIDQTSSALNNQYAYDKTGLAVDVHIIDSGIRATHTDFLDPVTNVNRVVTVNNYVVNSNGVPDPAGGSDVLNHGTGVASIIAGKTAGVAKRATIHSYRVVRSNNTSKKTWFSNAVDDIIAYKAAHPGRGNVINVSLIYEKSMMIDDAVKRALRANITVCVGSGNTPLPVPFNGTDPAGYSPQRVTGALTVAATGNTASGQPPASDIKASFSLVGAVVDLFAPGVAVRLAGNGSNTQFGDNSGTSFSAPYVSGVAALYLQDNPGAAPKTVRAAIRNNATPAVIDAGAGVTNRLLYSRVPSTTAVTLTFADEQSVCVQEGGVWNASFCDCDIPIEAYPNPDTGCTDCD